MTGTEGDPLEQPRSSATMKEELAYYKAQYEQLESELQEFQASSKELEAELEKDVEASEKRERQLKEKVEKLEFEVEEWKTKYKQSKNESNAAQTSLQKEITTLRETIRTVQFKLRDIEVVNDDYERQARHTTSSLEDLESKYNVAIERGVMLEEELKTSEQERESLRIETQRLRDELSDLRIEAEIRQEKLRRAEFSARRQRDRKSNFVMNISRSRSPLSEKSMTTVSSPTISTPPPANSETSTTAEVLTPPSPPLSDASGRPRSIDMTPLQLHDNSIAPDANATPRPIHFNLNASVHRRDFSTQASSNARISSVLRRPPTVAARTRATPRESLPRSGSLYQIRGLIGKMQKLEERVHSVRSKLPAPTNTTPGASPMVPSAVTHNVPASVTVRSSRKRPSGNITPFAAKDDEATPTLRPRTSRLSFGTRPPSRAQVECERPASRASARPDGSQPESGRPSSRSSMASHSSSHPPARPRSRASMTGPKVPMGHQPSRSVAESRPRSSIGGNYVSMHGHRGHSASVDGSTESDLGFATPAARRTTLDKSSVGKGVPLTPGLARRQSGGVGAPLSATPGSRVSTGLDHKKSLTAMGPPERRRGLSDVGETF